MRANEGGSATRAKAGVVLCAWMSLLVHAAARRRGRRHHKDSSSWDTAAVESLVSSVACGVERVQAVDMSRERFEAEFRGSLPVVIKDLVGFEQWPALQRWQRKEFVDRFGERTVHVRRRGSAADRAKKKSGEGGSKRITVNEYLSREFDSRLVAQDAVSLAQLHETNYQIDRRFMAEDAPELNNDFNTPSIFRSLAEEPLQPESTRPFFYLGARGSGMGFHRHGEAWNAVVHGRKRWLLYPPGWQSSLLGILGPEQHSLDGLGWLRTFGELVAGTSIAPIECETTSGDVIYIPAAWNHATINIQDSIGVFRNHEPKVWADSAVHIREYHWQQRPADVYDADSLREVWQAQKRCADGLLLCLAETVDAAKALVAEYTRCEQDAVGVEHPDLLPATGVSVAANGVSMLEQVAALERPDNAELRNHWARGLFILGLAYRAPGPLAPADKTRARRLIVQSLQTGYSPVGWKEHIASIEALSLAVQKQEAVSTVERTALLERAIRLSDAAVALPAALHGINIYMRTAVLANKAYLLIDLDQLQRASDAFKAAIDVDPLIPRLYLARAQTETRLSKTETSKVARILRNITSLMLVPCQRCMAMKASNSAIGCDLPHAGGGPLFGATQGGCEMVFEAEAALSKARTEQLGKGSQ